MDLIFFVWKSLKKNLLSSFIENLWFRETQIWGGKKQNNSCNECSRGDQNAVGLCWHHSMGTLIEQAEWQQCLCSVGANYSLIMRFFFSPGISELRLLLQTDGKTNLQENQPHVRACAPEDKVLCAWLRLISLLLFLVQTGLHKAFFPRPTCREGWLQPSPLWMEQVWPSMEKSGKQEEIPLPGMGYEPCSVFSPSAHLLSPGYGGDKRGCSSF